MYIIHMVDGVNSLGILPRKYETEKEALKHLKKIKKDFPEFEYAVYKWSEFNV